MFNDWHASTGGLVRFVLAMFVSLTLYKTYYANRGLLGTVFAEGSSRTVVTDNALAACLNNGQHHNIHPLS